MKKKELFDIVGKDYYVVSPAIPSEYVQLLVKTLHIKPEDRCLDLGCGSGEFTLKLKEYCSFFQGVDISKTMIDMAKKNDVHHEVLWTQSAIEDFPFKKDSYNHIISFEAIHLFSQQENIVRQCASALKSGGTLCLGWRMYSFDVPLRRVLEDVFAKYNIPYDWGFWMYPQLGDVISGQNLKLSVPKKTSISIPIKRSVSAIVDYILHISHSANFSEKLKRNLGKEFRERIMEVYPSGEDRGVDEYVLLYAQKIP